MWYLETRNLEAEDAGFGLGFERLIMFVTGMKNIRDVIPFPRTPQNAGNFNEQTMVISKQYQNLSPQQIQLLGILQLPIVSLEKRIEEELEENPALEEEEEEIKESAGYASASFIKNYEETQIEDKSDTLKDFLEKQLIDLTLNKDMLFLVKYLINSLNDNGFLGHDLYSISSDLLTNSSIDISEKDLLPALKILQSLEPVGVGAKNLQDCLLFTIKKIIPRKKELTK